jgi:hypothetical protein
MILWEMLKECLPFPNLDGAGMGGKIGKNSETMAVAEDGVRNGRRE